MTKHNMTNQPLTAKQKRKMKRLSKKYPETYFDEPDSMADLRYKWKLFYDGIMPEERKNIVIYFPEKKMKLTRQGAKYLDYNPCSLQVIHIEVLNKTKMARRMLKHLSEIGLI